MDLQKLFDRISFTKPIGRLDIDLLNELCLAFFSSVPFETLDMFGGKAKVLDLQIIYEKIVDQRRGGFCYELNGLMQWALCEIGFTVEKFEAHPYLRDQATFQDVSDHLTLAVTLENGERWLTDVGWGASSFSFPIRWGVLGEEQRQPNGVYRLAMIGDMVAVEKKRQTYLKYDNEPSMELRQEAESVDGEKLVQTWTTIYGFKPESCHDLKDFEEGFDYALNKNAVLLSDPMVVLQNKTGRKFLSGRRYVEKKYLDPETIKLVEARQCTKEEIYDVLRKEFGIVIDFDLKLKTQN